MNKETFSGIMELIILVAVITLSFFGVIIVEQINNRLGEQNVILKELVAACQNQADAIQEQNKILNYNPMEEGK